MSDLFLKYNDNLRVVPVIHNRIAFAQLVTLGLDDTSWRPDVIALELPKSIGKAVLRGLEHKLSGPLLVGKRVEENLQTTPMSELSHFQHTERYMDALARMLLAARRYAVDERGVQPDCDPNKWLACPDIGFEPYAIINGKFDGESYFYSNVVFPERMYHASQGYAGPPEFLGNKHRREFLRTQELCVRVWYTPPYYGGLPDARRARWIHSGNEEHVPKTTDRPKGYASGNPQFKMICHALKFCRKHLIVVSPGNAPPDDESVELAAESNIRIVHVPSEAVGPDDLEIVMRDEHEHSPEHARLLPNDQIEVFPLGPGDAYTAALRHRVRSEVEIAWVDMEVTSPNQLWRLNHRPPLSDRGSTKIFLEDALLMEEGLQSFCSRTAHIVASTRVPEDDGEREQFMAWNLSRLTAQNRQVLFICGAAHWEPIRKLLDAPARIAIVETKPVSTIVEAELYCSGRYALRRLGDEAPDVLAKYDRMRLDGRAAEFNAFQMVNDLDRRIRRRLIASGEVSPSDLIKYTTYVNRLCRHTGVVVPRLFHLEAAAHACLGEKGCQAVYRESMRFYDCPDGLPQLSGVSSDPNGLRAYIDGSEVAIQSRYGALHDAYDSVEERLVEPGDDWEKEGNGLRYADAEWEVHLRNMTILARTQAHPKITTTEAYPSAGVLNGPIDPRATVRARARGGSQLFQRLQTQAALKTLNEFEHFDPIVWLFEAEPTTSIERLWLDEDTADPVIGIVATLREDISADSHKCCFELIATWVPRFSDGDPAMLKRIKRWIGHGNVAYIPTDVAYNDFLADPKWVDFSQWEKVLLLALKYCREYVVFVGACEPSPRVREQFRASGKRLHYVSLSHFSDTDIETLRTPTFKERSS